MFNFKNLKSRSFDSFYRNPNQQLFVWGGIWQENIIFSYTVGILELVWLQNVLQKVTKLPIQLHVFSKMPVSLMQMSLTKDYHWESVFQKIYIHFLSASESRPGRRKTEERIIDYKSRFFFKITYCQKVQRDVLNQRTNWQIFNCGWSINKITTVLTPASDILESKKGAAMMIFLNHYIEIPSSPQLLAGHIPSRGLKRHLSENDNWRIEWWMLILSRIPESPKDAKK